ncbi:uncharacterized protein [Bemisia tabaci]|uniref:uncharacterized protein n=1 Tax=Bemisia tabaci TaxID=7038 RepID=UPI003B28D30E
MKDLYGYNFSGPDCSKKFSNLRTTYLTIRKRLRPTGASGDGKPGELDENDENDDEAGIMLDTKESDQGTKWEFHQIFRENFGSKASVEPGAHLLGATFNAAPKPAAARTACRPLLEQGKEKIGQMSHQEVARFNRNFMLTNLASND